MRSQHARAERFAALHRRPEPFLLPNPADAGTARLLAGLGFEALGTTSLGVAIQRGVRRVSRRDALENGRQIAQATDLPVTFDLENGFADEPAEVARIVREAADGGAVGASIEDGTWSADHPIYDFAHAVERVAAAVEAARALPIPFVLTARAENHLCGIEDLDDTIRRLQAFEEAGADVLYAPGLRSLDPMRRVVEAVSKPVNVVMGFADPAITLEQLAAIGVRRVSIGGGLCRVAAAAFLAAAGEMRAGRFGFVRDMAPLSALQGAFPE